MWVCMGGTWWMAGGMGMACSFCVDDMNKACRWHEQGVWPVGCGWRVVGVY